MPPDIPDETWVHIIELCPFEHSESSKVPCNLALTCRRLHQIATPFVYRALGFSVDFVDRGEDRSYGRTMTGFIRDLTRARSLFQAPHLLRHVRQLTLKFWNDYGSRIAISEQYFSPGRNSEDPVHTQDAGNFIFAVYDIITSLIPHMPGLQQLKVTQSPMTRPLYNAICSLPRLNSLHFMFTAFIHDQSMPIDPPPTLQIRELQCYDPSENEYFSNILAGSITSLHTLSVTSINLPLISTHICNRDLPLKTLQVLFFAGISPYYYDSRSALWDTLRATPELRKLLIHDDELDVPPPGDLRSRLPNLFQLSAAPNTVRILAEGKELDALELNRPFHISEQSIARSVPCSPTHLRVLILHAVSLKTQQELDTFISSFHMFQRLEYLDISHYFPDIPATDADFYESWKVIKYLWWKLKDLRRFNLCGFDRFEFNEAEPYGIEVACPLDLDDEPLSRGHPALEGIGASFLRESLWIWDPEHGWVSSRWSFSGWDDGSYTSWNQI